MGAGSGDASTGGSLSVRTLGPAQIQGSPASVIVLLHGLTGSGDGFGAGFDPLSVTARLVMPDLLGFGASLDVDRDDFSLPAHPGALDTMARELALDGSDLTVAGHSMGAVLALHWAAQRRDVRRVVLFCAPLYVDRDEAIRHVQAMGLLERLFAFESPLAARTCALMCKYRHLAQWMAVAISPQWPVPLARQGVLHTWPAYLGAMNGIIQGPGWLEALAALDARHVPIVLADGARDPVPVAGRARTLANRFPSVTMRLHESAGHDLPVAYPQWCADLLAN